MGGRPPGRPFYRDAVSDLALPLTAHFRQELSPNVAGATGIATIEHLDMLIRQRNSRIYRSDGRIVPVADRTQIYPRKHFAGEAQLLRDARQIIDRYDCPHDRRQLQQFGRALANSSSFMGTSLPPKSLLPLETLLMPSAEPLAKES